MTDENENKPVTTNQNQPVNQRKVELRYEAPYPPSIEVQKYNVIYPGAAKIIFDSFDRTVKAKTFIDKLGVVIELFGQVFGFILALTLIIGSFWLVYMGKDVAGVAGLISVITGLVLAFRYSKRDN